MNVLITGGAGFIGSHTADKLIQLGHNVKIIDNLDPQVHGSTLMFPSYLNKKIEMINSDINDVDAMISHLNNVDIIYHMASLTGVGQSFYDLKNYHHVNCTGTASLIEAVLKSKINLKRIILSSSRAVYGEGNYKCDEHGIFSMPIRNKLSLENGDFHMKCPVCNSIINPILTNEDKILTPASIYGQTKKYQEDLLLMADKLYGLPVTILRYFNVYGSRQSLINPYTGIVSIFYNQLKNHETINLYENGIPTRDFVHVNDIVQANILAMNLNIKSGTIFNIGSGENLYIDQMATQLSQLMNVPFKFNVSNYFRLGDILSCVADLNRSNNMLGYSPSVSLKEGLNEFIFWCRTH